RDARKRFDCRPHHPGDESGTHHPEDGDRFACRANQSVEARRGRSMLMTSIMSRHIVLASMCLMAASVEAVDQPSTVGELEKRLEEMQSQIVTLRDRVAELEAASRITPTNGTTNPVPSQSGTLPEPATQLRANEAKSLEEPTSLRYKGLSLTPGGFL